MSFRICNAPRVLLLCAAGWLASAASSPAAVLTVNNGGDSTVAGDGQVTLREAVIAAETDTVTDLGQTGSGPDRIDLTAFTGDFFILLAGPLPDITSTIELVGAGAAALRLGVSGGIGRLARIAGGRLTVRGLRVDSAWALGGDGANGGQRAGGGGGGAGLGGVFFLDSGTLELVDCAVFNSHAHGGAGGHYDGNGSLGPAAGGGSVDSDATGEAGAASTTLGGSGGSAGTGPGSPGGNGGNGAGGGGGYAPVFPDCLSVPGTGSDGGDGGWGGGGGGGGATCLNGGGYPSGGDGGFAGGGGGAGGNPFASGGSGLSGAAGSFGGAGGSSTGGGSEAGAGGGGAGLGGAIYARSGYLRLRNVGFASNVALGGAGGINTNPATNGGSGEGRGGAIFVDPAARASAVGLNFVDNDASSASGGGYTPGVPVDTDDVWGRIDDPLLNAGFESGTTSEWSSTVP